MPARAIYQSVTTFVPLDGAVIVETDSAGAGTAPSVKSELSVFVQARLFMNAWMHVHVCKLSNSNIQFSC
jgi:hypothetical protein